ncbi:hypothetical protein Pmar_PMAR003263 [Perkinsus marinus ATCC 50983]|uniref:Uncharacterized protein n=1 Tax=Perkinsus marinus (strain ATCC 50983 / TXsc) TaxID=423536 RepID=C5L5P7_PERM5|nr:hypothetical protein Pmar_PMAR003263 [Perkinsus marinus ATCC 50983]EER07944.1 hypothetical protein Pmar_PMAR003263 [Perkinsus marinus ATCC 50983]|eukprot:XP_002776128.1 hypothetical protein Pmar_PMAR003263 [Perkinsus marinus ATCC 50983]
MYFVNSFLFSIVFGEIWKRLSVSDVKGEFKLRRVIAKGGYNEAFSEDESFVNDDDYEEEEEEEESFINDDTSNEEESEEGSDGGVVARYNLINEKMDEERQKKRQSAGLTAFHEYLEFLTVSMCEPDAEMNEKYAASVKRIEGELEQARSARSTTAWDAHGGRYRRGLDLYPDLISRPTQINEESTRLLRRCRGRLLFGVQSTTMEVGCTPEWENVRLEEGLGRRYQIVSSSVMTMVVDLTMATVGTDPME